MGTSLSLFIVNKMNQKLGGQNYDLDVIERSDGDIKGGAKRDQKGDIKYRFNYFLTAQNQN